MFNNLLMSFTVFGLMGIPYVKEGDDIANLIQCAAVKGSVEFHDKDIIVVTQKIVSKAEGRVVRLDTVEPSFFSIHLGKIMEKDPHLVEVVLRETARIIRMKGRALIVETHHGHVCANAGVDFSNVKDGYVTLLPIDPNSSAKRIREKLEAITGKKLAIIITDTWGRAWRLGQVDFAIGISGMLAFRDYRGETDYMGHELNVTNIAIADELAAAAELVKGKSSGIPVVVIRGYDYPEGDGKASDIIRPIEEDLFR
jgi:coenzyme F420-0:L-glutamate ligase/coenzyme F420-1:gamma-L-glutamate ligase